MDLCFVEFEINDQARLAALCTAFEELKHDKETETWRDEEDWLAIFDDAALAAFWWPSKEEEEAYWARWQSTPVDQRQTDPTLRPPSWEFSSMIDAFRNGEYRLIACQQRTSSRGRLEFEPLAFPYGGTGCMKMLVEAFGFHVIAEDAGTGYRSYN